MVRAQLYLPEDLYNVLKKKSSSMKMTFASYVRMQLENDKDLKPVRKNNKEAFLALAGTVSGANDESNNEKIDQFLYDL